MPGIAADSAVQAAAVVPLLPVVVTGAVAVQAVLPSARTGFPGSWPFSAAPASRQSSSGPAAWHKSGLSESRHCILMVSRGNQFLSFLEMLLVLLPFLFLLFRLLGLCILRHLALGSGLFRLCLELRHVGDQSPWLSAPAGRRLAGIRYPVPAELP